MILLNVIYILLALIYTAIIFYFYRGLQKLSGNPESGYTPMVSVLVPARNEQQNILQCLEGLWNQSYPKELYEVFVIDDHSSDGTGTVVERYIKDKPNFTLLRHNVDPLKQTFKKQALKFGLEQVSGEVIMTIDADTVAQPSWIREILDHYQPDTGLVAGLITFDPEKEKTLFHKIQTLEFAGIVFCGVGAAGNENPLICNGSNLSYRLEAFRNAGGYKGNEHLPSGDDDLLLQNIHNKTDWKITYAVSNGSINYTAPVNTLTDFLNQRARWASKSRHYPKRWLFMLMVSVYLFYVSLAVLLPLVILQWFSWKIYLPGVLLKLVPEFLLVNKGLRILQRADLRRYFFPAQFFQIFYILIVGILGLRKKYTWKGRNGNSHP